MLQQVCTEILRCRRLDMTVAQIGAIVVRRRRSGRCLSSPCHADIPSLANEFASMTIGPRIGRPPPSATARCPPAPLSMDHGQGAGPVPAEPLGRPAPIKIQSLQTSLDGHRGLPGWQISLLCFVAIGLAAIGLSRGRDSILAAHSIGMSQRRAGATSPGATPYLCPRSRASFLGPVAN